MKEIQHIPKCNGRDDCFCMHNNNIWHNLSI
jgi:hypothetical protein